VHVSLRVGSWRRRPAPLRRARRVLAAALAGSLLAGAAAAVPQSCLDWRGEHRAWKAALLRRYLVGAPQAALDEAVFEMLQREVYLTTCPVSVRGARAELIGWRLLGLSPDAYPRAVLDSLLEQAGLELDLRRRFRLR
jgi:hypothetical protein